MLREPCGAIVAVGRLHLHSPDEARIGPRGGWQELEKPWAGQPHPSKRWKGAHKLKCEVIYIPNMLVRR